MAKFRTANVDGSAFSAYGKVERIAIRRSNACHGRAVCAFTAPGWRSMHFTSIEAAEAKMQHHPGFMGWVA